MIYTMNNGSMERKGKICFKQLNYRAMELMTFDHDALGPP